MADQSFIAVGDVHGCPRSLEAILDKLEKYDRRQVVFVGDYIDRGPDSKDVVDLLLDYREERECVFLRGNHEQMMLDAYDHGDLSLWLMNGGRTTLQSYGLSPVRGGFELPEEHMRFYRETRLYYDTPDYFFVHAGLAPHKTVAQSIGEDGEGGEGANEFLWERSHLQVAETSWEKTVVFGHTPMSQPVRKDRMLGIDTGCVYTSRGYGTLTAVLLPEEEFVQQKCLDV